MSLEFNLTKRTRAAVLKRWHVAEPELPVLVDKELSKIGWKFLGVGAEYAQFVWTKGDDEDDQWSLVHEYEIVPGGASTGRTEVSSRFSVCCEGVGVALATVTGKNHWPKVSLETQRQRRVPARLFSVSPEWLAINSSRAVLGSLFSFSDEPELTLNRFLSNLALEVEPLIEETRDIQRLARFLLRVREVPNHYGGSGFSLNRAELYAAILLSHLGLTGEAHAALLADHEVMRRKLVRLGLGQAELDELRHQLRIFEAYIARSQIARD